MRERITNNRHDGEQRTTTASLNDSLIRLLTSSRHKWLPPDRRAGPGAAPNRVQGAAGSGSTETAPSGCRLKLQGKGWLREGEEAFLETTVWVIVQHYQGCCCTCGRERRGGYDGYRQTITGHNKNIKGDKMYNVTMISSNYASHESHFLHVQYLMSLVLVFS